MYKWRDSDLEKFLELYQNQECLWNSNIASYKDKQARESAYFMIQTFMCNDDITIDDIKSKIKTIRSTYSAELNKIVKSLRSEDGYVYKPKLFWFNQADSFLREVVSTRRSTSKQLLERMQSPTSPGQEDHIFEVTLENQEMCSPIEPARERIINTINKPMILSTITLDDQPAYSPDDCITQSMQGAVNTNGRLTNQSVKDECENEFDLFGRAVGIQLKKMTLPRALACQEAIQRLITNERLRPPFRRRRRLIKKNIVKYEDTPTQIQYILGAPE